MIRELLIDLVFMRVGIVALSGLIFCTGVVVGMAIAAVAVGGRNG